MSTGKFRVLTAAAAAAALLFGSLAMATSASASAGNPPVNTVAPVITGTAVVGNTLTVSNGTWTTDAAPLTYTYTWTDENGNYLGGDASFTAETDDIGHTLTATVAATDTSDAGDSVDVTMTSAVVASSVVNTVLPVITGTLTVGSTLTADNGTWTAPSGLTYTYDWGRTTGQSGDSLNDFTNSYTITADDIGFYISVNVKASTGTEQGTAIVTTELIVPTAPFATDAGLTAANKGTVTATQPNTTTAVVSVPAAQPGDTVYVYAYSTPVALGFYTLDANGQITVSLAALPAGTHRLLILNSAGAVIGWAEVTAGSVLAATGGTVSVPLVAGGGALVLFGLLSVLYAARARRKLGTEVTSTEV